MAGKKIVAPPGYKPRVYGYGRASHEVNSASDSIPGQQARVFEHYQRKFAAEFGWGDWVADKITSAYKIPFFKRPGGKMLLATMLPGDVLIIDKVDRIWRSVADFVGLLDRLEQRKVRIVFVNNPELDPTTAHGRLMLTIAVAFAQFDSQFKSERIKEGLKRSKSAGIGSLAARTRPGVAVYPRPNPLAPERKYNVLVWWFECRRLIMDRIVQLRDVYHMEWLDIAKQIEAEMIEYRKVNGESLNKEFFYRHVRRKIRPGKAIPRPFRMKDAQQYYIAEKEIRHYGITDPRDWNRTDHPAISLEAAELVNNPCPEMITWEEAIALRTT